VTCAHHWVIETPSGPVSQGTCKVCGEEREFENSTDIDFIRNQRLQRAEAVKAAKRGDPGTHPPANP